MVYLLNIEYKYLLFNIKFFIFLKENDLRNLLQKKKMEKEERYRTADYKHHQKKEIADNNSRDTYSKIKKREEEEERDNRRSHRERDQYIEQYYKMLDRPRKF